MKINDKLKCLHTINNIFEQPLFIKDKIYNIIDIDNDSITLNHILYSNEYISFNSEFIKNNFTECH